MSKRFSWLNRRRVKNAVGDEMQVDADGNPIEQPLQEQPVAEPEPAPAPEENASDELQKQIDTLYTEIESLRGELAKVLKDNGTLQDENDSVKKEAATSNRKLASIEIDKLVGHGVINNETREIILNKYIEDKQAGLALIRALVRNQHMKAQDSSFVDNVKKISGINRIQGRSTQERVDSFRKLPKG